MWNKQLRRFAVPLQRLVRRFAIRRPCWICDRCGWRERREAEVRCWKCGGEMLFHVWPALRFGRDKRRQWYGQFVQHDGLRYAVHSTRLLYVLRRLWQERWRMKPSGRQEEYESISKAFIEPNSAMRINEAAKAGKGAK